MVNEKGCVEAERKGAVEGGDWGAEESWGRLSFIFGPLWITCAVISLSGYGRSRRSGKEAKEGPCWVRENNFGPDGLKVHMANSRFNLDVRLFLLREADRSTRCFGGGLGKATKEFGRRLGEHRVICEDVGDCCEDWLKNWIWRMKRCAVWGVFGFLVLVYVVR